VENNGSLSPDGKWLAYMSDLAGGGGLYVQSFPGKEGRWQVATDATRLPVWSRDGRELFYLDRSGQVMAVPVNAGATWQSGAPHVLLRTRNSGSFGIHPDGRRFLVLDYQGGGEVPTLNVVLNWPSALK
jgi:Tol biopolymer transport system component